MLCVTNKSLSFVLFFVTPQTVARQAPLSLGFSRAGILEWVAISFFRRSSGHRDQAHISCIAGGFSTAEPVGGMPTVRVPLADGGWKACIYHISDCGTLIVGSMLICKANILSFGLAIAIRTIIWVCGCPLLTPRISLTKSLHSNFLFYFRI